MRVSKDTAEFITQDPVARETYNALRERGLTHEEARKDIARAMQAAMWAVEHELVYATQATERVVYPALRRMAKGESARDLFRNWQGEPL